MKKGEPPHPAGAYEPSNANLLRALRSTIEAVTAVRTLGLDCNAGPDVTTSISEAQFLLREAVRLIEVEAEKAKHG